jgi:multidrug efflux system membrane fusion protein
MVTGTEPNGLVVITQLQPITVVFSVPQDNVATVMKRVQSGDKLPVEAWDRELKTKLATGVLASVDNVVDPATGTVKLRAQFANDDNALFPNQFVNVRMKLDTQRDAIVIPSSAVQRGAQGFFVYVVKPDQTATVRAVKPGTIDGQRIAIAEGLAPGEVVVIDGMDRMREGARVEVTQRPEFKPPVEGPRGAGKGMRREGKAPPGPAAK